MVCFFHKFHDDFSPNSLLWIGLKQIEENRWYLLFGVYAGIILLKRWNHFETLQMCHGDGWFLTTELESKSSATQFFPFVSWRQNMSACNTWGGKRFIWMGVFVILLLIGHSEDDPKYWASPNSQMPFKSLKSAVRLFWHVFFHSLPPL